MIGNLLVAPPALQLGRIALGRMAAIYLVPALQADGLANDKALQLEVSDRSLA